MCDAWLPLIAASSELTTARLTEFCFYLPFGLLLAVVIVEVFAGGRKSLDLDKAVVVLLVAASVLLFGSAFLTFSEAGTIGPRAATRAAGFSVGLGVLSAIAALMKQQCYLQKLIALTRAKQRSRTRHATGSAWSAFYVLFLLASLAGAVGMAVLRPDLANETGLMAQTEPLETDLETSQKDSLPEIDSEPATEPPPLRSVAMSDITAHDNEEAVTPPMDAAEIPEEASEPVPEPAPPLVAETSGEPEEEEEPQQAIPVDTAARTINPAAVQAFKSRVVPILESKCTSCHGSEKQKGGLRLDSPSWIRKGGDSGPVVVAFDPDKSYLYTSIVLPADDPDVMPAKGKPLSKSQTTLIRNWIQAGAPMGDGKDQQAAALANASATANAPTAANDFAGMPASVAQQLETSHIQFKDLGDGLFEIDCSLTRNYEEVTLDLSILQPIAGKVHTLDLSKTKVSDSDLANVTTMSNLRRLLLSRTSIGDSAMEHVAPLTKLEILNLYGTNVSDNGLEALSGLTNLKKLYLWNSKATSKGGDKLKATNPGLVVNVGQ